MVFKGADRYDKKARHDHLVCSVCGKIKDVYLPDMICSLESGCGEELVSYDLNMYYVCDECK